MNKIILGDCLEKLKELEDNSVDSIVTDPPYELGFMGKSWDNTGIANNHLMWKECLRVLKPGGHLLAFSGTRTYHRMAVAIEDAGFEVRDMIEWVYGSGFPKSLSIGKAVDKMRNKNFDGVRSFLKTQIDKSGLTHNQLLEKLGLKQGSGLITHWTTTNKESYQILPSVKQWNNLKLILGFSDEFDDDITEHEREIVGTKKSLALPISQELKGWGEKQEYNITVPATEIAKQWEGWGTALKPAHEPICMARKPLAEKTVAENCLKWNVGGLNVDASRVESVSHESYDSNVYKDLSRKDDRKTRKQNTAHQDESASLLLPQNDPLANDGKDALNLKSPQDSQSYCLVCSRPNDEHPRSEVKDDLNVSPLLCDAHGLPFRSETSLDNPLLKSSSYNKNINIDVQSQGRWPSNLIHDNSEEVRECFPETKSTQRTKPSDTISKPNIDFGGGWKSADNEYADSGNASRFFKSIIYQAKASRGERTAQGTITNGHPTIKPIALMEYLIKMVTPKGGIVLDPFAGSGSTLVAAKQNGFQYIGIEMTEEYIPIIEARLKADVVVGENLIDLLG